MTHRDIEILMQMAIDKTLPESGRDRLRDHLADCPECRDLYEEYTVMDNLLKDQLPAIEVPAGFAAGVIAALPEFAPIDISESIPAVEQKITPAVVTNPLPAVLTRPDPRRRMKKYISRISMVAVAAALLLLAGLSGWFDGEDPQIDSQIPIASIDPITKDDYMGPHQDFAVVDDELDLEDNDSSDPIIVAENDDNQNLNEDDPGQETVDEPQTDNPAPQEPIDPEPGDELTTYNGGIPLPEVAYGNEDHGGYTLYTLAANTDFDVVLFEINGAMVNYWLDAEDVYLKYQADLNGDSEPQYISENEDLPQLTVKSGISDLSAEYGYNYISAVSLDVMRLALNQGGEESGLYIIDQTSENGQKVLADANGGGSIVDWAPDSNKVLYTTVDGSLKVYYPDQDLSIGVYIDSTAYAVWANDSHTLVFSAMDSETGHLALFSFNVP